ncbi:hypothetical protein [Sulfitobacter sp. R18_1]|uniref:hypothetical protein n=1 Tax=Sulfitobacter sp. R18_1 TaxID=2821104 RepID=UPI001ADC66DB|nr:hypothetical protein [Sulfitobacter sp. R18_1]MBO9428085.1 hypothetical protein [Sulfitobacter sp. R18_1]
MKDAHDVKIAKLTPELEATIKDMSETCDSSLEAITYLSAVFSDDHPAVPFMSSSEITQSMEILSAVEFGAGGLDVFLKCLEEDMQALGDH